MDILEKNKDISGLSNFKTKAFAKYYFEIRKSEDILKLREIYKYSKSNSLPILFIGGGTNLLFAFDLYNGIIIRNLLSGWKYDTANKILESYSSESISEIALKLYNDYNQIIWKRFIGLPGSIGGAIFGNAGCFGLETQNNFLKADILDIKNGKIKTFFKKDMDFGYRNSIIKKENNFFVIKAYFDLSRIEEKYSSDVDNIDFRENKQPKGNTCGSFFKNPSKEQTAGKLIEEVGLKGFKLGGAFFSEKHANFLMNDGSASYKDLTDLIKLAQNKVKYKFNIDLIPEVIIVYN